jgi:VWFA-related protein
MTLDVSAKKLLWPTRHWPAAAALAVSLITPLGLAQAQEVPPSPPRPSPTPGYTMRIDTSLVTVDVSVLTEDGYFVYDLNKEDFRLLEDGVPQTVTSFSQLQAPVTVVFLVEFNANTSFQQILALRACTRFTRQLKPDDWVALVLFDKRPNIALDFTQDKSAVNETVMNAGLPLSRETNMFDALDDTLDRLQAVEGRKYIVLMTTGIDTFSRQYLDPVLKKIEQANQTVIYSIDVLSGLGNPQAHNQLRAFARMTGGRYYQAATLQDYDDLFRDIGQSVRNRYVLSYHPPRHEQDGAWHKIKVQITDLPESAEGAKQLNGHRHKYQIVAREGYRASPDVP